MNKIWRLQDAKSKFSQVIHQAVANGAQIISSRGKKVAVVLSYDDYERLTRRRQGQAQFLLDSPLAGSNLTIQRNPVLPREPLPLALSSL